MNNYLLIFVTLFCLLGNLMDLWSNNFDAHFSENTLKKLRVKDNSFLRKIIPFKEGFLKDRSENCFSYRYCLTIRAIPYFLSIIAFIIIVPIVIVNIFISYIPSVIIWIISIIFILIHFIRLLIITICSQGLHL